MCVRPDRPASHKHHVFRAVRPNAVRVPLATGIHTMSSVLVLNGVEVAARESDNYVPATPLCNAAQKKWNDYWRLEGTQAFILKLVESTGIPADSLVQAKSGRNGGTWIHPQVVIHFAQWVSAEFAVQVTAWVLQLLTTGRVELAPADALTELEALHRATGQLLEQERRLKKVEVSQADLEVEVQRIKAHTDRFLELMLLKVTPRGLGKPNPRPALAKILDTPELLETLYEVTSSQGGLYRCLSKASGASPGLVHKMVSKERGLVVRGGRLVAPLALS